MEKEDSAKRITQIDKGSMKRVLKVADLFAVGYGDLGSSIYYALGITALFALGATPLALLFAGFVFSCTALTYAELSSMLQESGGSAYYSRHAFNDLVSFIAGWGLLLDYIVTIAISSYSVAPYLSYFFSFLTHVEYKILFTIGLICVLFFLNVLGSKHSTRLSIVLTSMTLLTQIIIIVIGGIWLLDIKELFSHMKIGVPDSPYSPTWGGFWKGCAMAMVAFTGIESMTQLSAEAKTPSKTVPRAILLSMGILLFVYMGISSVALSAVSPHVLSTTFLDDPIAGIVSVLPFGKQFLGVWVGLLAAIILFVAANAGLMGASRLSFNMGEHYQLPRFIYRLHPKFKTPFVSLAIFAVFAMIIVIWSGGRISALADLYNFGAMLAFTAAHFSLLTLRVRKSKEHRPFRAPLNIRIKGYDFPLTAIIGGLATFSTWCLVVITKPDGRYLGFAWIFFGLIMYYLYRRKQKIKPTAQVRIEKIKIPGFRPLVFKNILVPTRGGRETETVQVACELAKVHGAKVTALNIIRVPFSLPLESPESLQVLMAESALKRAEAIGREFGVAMELKMINSRSIDTAVFELIKTMDIDLLVIGASSSGTHGFGQITDKILKEAKCRVFVCCHKAYSSHENLFQPEK